MQKSCSADKSTMYVDNIRQSSERMREMLNTLLDFFRLDNGKEQPNLSPCRISAITHILETEFMPIAMNKGLTLIVESHTDAVVLTDKERILQIGNNLLSNAIIYSYLLQKYNICSDNQLLMKSFFTCCIVETAFPVSFATFRIE